MSDAQARSDKDVRLASIYGARARNRTLLAAGFEPLPSPCPSKHPTYRWGHDNLLEITQAWLDAMVKDRARKPFTNTGIRTGNTVGVDLDVWDTSILNALDNALDNALGTAGIPASDFVRIGRAPRELLVYRTEKPFRKLRTRTWRRADEPEAKELKRTYQVEILGLGQQFMAFGQHPAGLDYEWPVRDLLEVSVEELPAITQKQAKKLVEVAEEVFASAGLVVCEGQRGNAAAATKEQRPGHVWDKADHRFHGLSWEEILEGCRPGDTHDRLVVVSASMVTSGETDQAILELCVPYLDRGSDRRSEQDFQKHCIDSARAKFEGEASANLSRQLEDIGRLGKRLAGGDEASADATGGLENHADNALGPQVWPAALRLPGLSPGQSASMTQEELDENVLRAVARYVYCPGHDRYLDLSRVGEDGWRVTPGALERSMEGFFKEVRSSKGRVTLDTVYDRLKRLKQVVQPPMMRPDRAPGIFEEDGERHVNLCRIPALPREGGDATVGLRYFEWLYPVPEQHDWFLLHLRHKTLHPEIPGPAIVNVAHDGSGRELEGSGRNRLTHILKRLFGSHHVKDLQFSDVLSIGRGGWNDWIEHSLCAVISEVADTSSRGDYRERRRQMDFLKTLVEPGAEEVQRRKRNTDDANVVSYVSWFFNTNHIDALPILEQSRRFAVLENPCVPMDPDFAAELMAWLEAPENVGALKHELIAFESALATYSPYAPPPVTAAKLRMAEAHQNDLDEAFEQIFSVLTEGLLCKEMILAVLEDPGNGWDLPTGYKGVAAGEFRRRARSLRKSVVSSGQIRLRQDSPALKLTGARETHLSANRRLIMRTLDRHDEWLRCHATEKWHESADGNWNRLIKAGLLTASAEAGAAAHGLEVISGGGGVDMERN